MRIHLCPVHTVRNVAENIFVLRFSSPALAESIRPGQFLNIRVSTGNDPFLRRPFSVYRVDGEYVEIIFNVVGRGTASLREKRMGETVDVLGPLGVPFRIGGSGYESALLVAGGLGVAPMPITASALRRLGKTVATFLGARSGSHVASEHLDNLRVATDDGSEGFHGTVVDLLEVALREKQYPRPRIFGCGPTPMLRALAGLARSRDIPCEVSLEGPMACGIGICQGCPVELAEGERKYALLCTEGPTFDIRNIRI